MGANCDVCSPTLLSRTFNGILIRKNGVAHKWIDEPYTIRQQSGNILQFVEQIPNPDQINISLTQTPFSTIQGFIDSTVCFCTSGGGGGTTYYAGTGILISGDTIYNAGDLLTNNEGVLGVGAGGANSSLITSNTTGANGVTVQGWSGINVSETTSTNGGKVIISAIDTSATNEIQNLSLSEQSLGISGGTGVTLPVIGITAGTNISVSNTAGNYTINTTGVPTGSGAATQIAYWGTSTSLTGSNNLWWDNTNARLGVRTNSPTSTADFRIAANTPGVIVNYNYFTGTSQRPLAVINQDNLETFAIGGNRTANEGNLYLNAPSVQGSGAGINFSSNNGASTQTGLFQLDNSGNMVFRQANGSMFYDYYSATFFRDVSNGFATKVHINNTGLAVNTTSHNATLHVNGTARITGSQNTAANIMGRDANGDVSNVALGSGLSISAGTLNYTNTGYVNGGNSYGANATIGLNDNFDWAFETNNTNRAWLKNTGQFTIGSTASTAAQFVINGLGSAVKGMALIGGGGLVSPEFITMTGTGTGSTATALRADINMTSGTVVASLNNTATTGTGGAAFTAATESTATGDPYIALGVNGGSNWTIGIDNSDLDKMKVGPASLPGNTQLGLTILTDGKTGIGTNAPDYNMNVDGIIGVGLPLGTTLERPTTLTDPIIRFNSTFGGFEVANPTNGVYYRLSATATPSISGNTAQVGTGATLTLLTGSNDVTGRIQIDTGTGTLSAGSSAVSITFAAAYNSAAQPRIILTPANANAVSPGYYVNTTNHLSYQIGCVNAMANSTTYIINYEVRQ